MEAVTVIWQGRGRQTPWNAVFPFSLFFFKVVPHGKGLRLSSSKKGTATVLQLHEECLLCCG